MSRGVSGRFSNGTGYNRPGQRERTGRCSCQRSWQYRHLCAFSYALPEWTPFISIVEHSSHDSTGSASDPPSFMFLTTPPPFRRSLPEGRRYKQLVEDLR